MFNRTSLLQLLRQVYNKSTTFRHVYDKSYKKSAASPQEIRVTEFEEQGHFHLELQIGLLTFGRQGLD